MPDDLTVEPFITAIDAAKALHINIKTLARYRVEGVGPRYFKLGNGRAARVLYRLSDLVAWVEGFERRSTSETGTS